MAASGLPADLIADRLSGERVAAELRRRFPGSWAWRGEHTGTWWAIARDRAGRDRLIEAPDPYQLGRRLETIGVLPVLPSQAGTAMRSPRRPDVRTLLR
jgi:hypothetical protein